jgi:histone-lysine N-methyltransferase SETD7
MFTDPVGPTLTYSPPTHHSLGVEDPTLPDQYEARTVEVLVSQQSGAQEGLFTLRQVEAGEIVAFYSGFIIHCESSLRALDRREMSDEEEHERNMYNIALDIGEEDQNLCIDLPPDLGHDLSRYRATLGHKVNHSFRPNCEFVLLSSHPVLGTVMGLAATEDLLPHVELSVNYGYNVTSDPDQPAWFVELWDTFYSSKESEDHREEL